MSTETEAILWNEAAADLEYAGAPVPLRLGPQQSGDGRRSVLLTAASAVVVVGLSLVLGHL